MDWNLLSNIGWLIWSALGGLGLLVLIMVIWVELEDHLKRRASRKRTEAFRNIQNMRPDPKISKIIADAWYRAREDEYCDIPGCTYHNTPYTPEQRVQYVAKHQSPPGRFTFTPNTNKES